jgi:hypothetical protein
MNLAKIRLSPTEMDMVNNADLILTKNAILKKVNQLLGQLQSKQQEYVSLYAKGLPQKISVSSPKISKGENYKGLPYLILDYPRLFEHENIFAIRTMFWWGNFFSVTLHLSGVYKKDMEEKLIASYNDIKEKGYYCCKNEDPWEHHFEELNYVSVREINKNDFEKIVHEKIFVKLAKKIPLQNWDDAESLLAGCFKDIMEWLTG